MSKNKGKVTALVDATKYIVGEDPWPVLANILERHGYRRPHGGDCAEIHLNNIIKIIERYERLNILDVLKEKDHAKSDS